MKRTALLRPLTFAALVLLALSPAVACGDDDDGPGDDADGEALSGYFAGIEEVFGDAEEATTEAEERLNEAADAPLDERISALETYLEEIDAVFSEAVRRLQELGAPSLAGDVHERFIDGVEESMSAGDELLDDLSGIATEEQLEERLSEFDNEVEGAVEKSEEACMALQEIADDREIGVDLDCED